MRAEPQGPYRHHHETIYIRCGNMEQKKIDRINELAHKAKTPEGLTPEETAERAALRQEYLNSVMGNLRRELDNTWIVDEHGNKRKLTPGKKTMS